MYTFEVILPPSGVLLPLSPYTATAFTFTFLEIYGNMSTREKDDDGKIDRKA